MLVSVRYHVFKIGENETYIHIIFLCLICSSKAFSQGYYGKTDDIKFNEQWNLTKVQAVNAWEYFSGSGVKIAVLDTGYDLDHPDLEGNYYRDISANIAGNIQTQQITLIK